MALTPGSAIVLAAALSILIWQLRVAVPGVNDSFASSSASHYKTKPGVIDFLARNMPRMPTPFWCYFILVQATLFAVAVKYVYQSRCKCPLCTPRFKPKYRFVKVLGEGSFARVHLVAKEQRGDGGHHGRRRQPSVYLPFAVKQARIDDVTDCNEGMFEMELLLRVEHPSLVQVEDQFFHKERDWLWRTALHYCIVMEYCGGGDLFDLIDRAVKYHGGISEQECLEMFTQVLEGVEFMHSKNIMHRDIKPDNILVNGSGDLKIGDLGLGEKLRKKLVRGGYAGTEGYIAPEIWQGHAYGKACDVWSLGVLLFTMCSWLDIMEILREEGLAEESDNDCIEVILRKPSCIELLLTKVEHAPTVHQLIRQMLVLKPKARPTCAQLLGSSLLKPYRQHGRVARKRGGRRGSAFRAAQSGAGGADAAASPDDGLTLQSIAAAAAAAQGNSSRNSRAPNLTLSGRSGLAMSGRSESFSFGKGGGVRTKGSASSHRSSSSLHEGWDGHGTPPPGREPDGPAARAYKLAASASKGSHKSAGHKSAGSGSRGAGGSGSVASGGGVKAKPKHL